MGSALIRPRVYLAVVHHASKMRRVLDLAFIDGTPIAVISWVKVDGELKPGDYVELDPRLLRKSQPEGTFWYGGVVQDPRVPPAPAVP